MNTETIFEKLFRVIEQRKKESPDTSYVARLMDRGIEKINSKIIEEAEETCQAGSSGDREHLVHEICDLLFHTFVLAGYRDIHIDDIAAELERRFGTSGLVEKARRKENDPS
ncbi:MAG: phosphoribosyl-ATP diphosphatase [Spirochaetota bacterium]